MQNIEDKQELTDAIAKLFEALPREVFQELELVLSDYHDYTIGHEIKKYLRNLNMIEKAMDKALMEVFDHGLDHFKVKTKKKEIALPRQIGMCILQKFTNCRVKEAGEMFGRDHATALHAKKTIAKRMSKGNMRIIDDYEALKNAFKKHLRT